MKISKYFWNLNEKALKETKSILGDSQNQKFIPRIVTLLSRCQEPKEVFSFVSKKDFIDAWPKINSYWRRYGQSPDFRNWWQTIYEQFLEQEGKKPAKSVASVYYLEVGKAIREARIAAGLSQKALAIKTGVRQPDISKIEEGRKNITLGTLARLCKILGIKRIELP